jgi:hypothetical protein
MSLLRERWRFFDVHETQAQDAASIDFIMHFDALPEHWHWERYENETRGDIDSYRYE